MTYSLNEIEAQTLKAARGVGLPWGMAEEAGKAARWLAAYRQPALDALAGLLELIDRRSYGDLAPVRQDQRWVGREGLVCAVTAGITLCDRAEAIAAGERFQTGRIAYPVLSLPFVAAAQRATGVPMGIKWPGVAIRIDSAGLYVEPGADVRAMAAEQYVCEARSVEPLGAVIEPETDGTDIDPALWARLAAFAQRTYVPASEQSRELGAGAGLDDND
jgi:hypothetical protein